MKQTDFTTLMKDLMSKTGCAVGQEIQNSLRPLYTMAVVLVVMWVLTVIGMLITFSSALKANKQNTPIVKVYYGDNNNQCNHSTCKIQMR